MIQGFSADGPENRAPAALNGREFKLLQDHKTGINLRERDVSENSLLASLY